jgi:hypothetical protein
MANQSIRVQIDEFFCKSLNSTRIGISPAIVDANILTVPPAEFLKALLKYSDPLANIGIAFGDRHQHADSPDPLAPLRPCRQRPCSRRASNDFYEISSAHVLPRGEDDAI